MNIVQYITKDFLSQKLLCDIITMKEFLSQKLVSNYIMKDFRSQKVVCQIMLDMFEV